MRGFLCGLLVLALGGCVTIPPPDARTQSAALLAQQAGWEPIRLPSGNFVLAAFVPKQILPGDTLTIYIEGDGLAWIGSRDISANPTPMHPAGLQIALHHPAGMAAYLARPCQYVEGSDARNCSNTWWTERRFAPEVVTATSIAVDQLKQRFNAKSVVLVGYSGGGAIAALLAAQRADVAQLVTVAGNLDHAQWTTMRRLDPLSGSLNAVDFWQALVDLPQIHYIGSNDSVVPREVTESFLAAFPQQHRPAPRAIDGFDHACCWAEKWAEIYTVRDRMHFPP